MLSEFHRGRYFQDLSNEDLLGAIPYKPQLQILGSQPPLHVPGVQPQVCSLTGLTGVLFRALLPFRPALGSLSMPYS